VTAGSWWQEKLRDELSQGDLLEGIPFVLAPMPVRYVKKHTVKIYGDGWFESLTPFRDKGGRTVLVAAGAVTTGIVLSHDCESDKQEFSKTLVLARVESMTTAPPEHRQAIIDQLNIPRMFLPGVPGLGDCYVNFRSVGTVDREVIRATRRIASMRDEARKLLEARIVKFFVRRVLPE
jgi:hypothetical protein